MKGRIERYDRLPVQTGLPLGGGPPPQTPHSQEPIGYHILPVAPILYTGLPWLIHRAPARS